MAVARAADAGGRPPRREADATYLAAAGGRHSRAAVFAVSALAVVLAACGGAEPSSGAAPSSTSIAANGIDAVDAAERLERAREALTKQRTYHVEGSTLGGGPLAITFVRGVGASGRLTTSFGGSDVALLAVRGNVYVKGDAEFIGTFVSSSAIKTLGKSWLQLTDDQAASLAVVTDADRFAAATLDLGSVLEPVPVTVVDSTAAAGVYSVSTGATVWIAAKGEPLPLRVDEQGATDKRGRLRFTDFGAKVSLSPPARGSVVQAKGLPAHSSTPSPSAAPSASPRPTSSPEASPTPSG